MEPNKKGNRLTSGENAMRPHTSSPEKGSSLWHLWPRSLWHRKRGKGLRQNTSGFLRGTLLVWGVLFICNTGFLNTHFSVAVGAFCPVSVSKQNGNLGTPLPAAMPQRLARNCWFVVRSASNNSQQNIVLNLL